MLFFRHKPTVGTKLMSRSSDCRDYAKTGTANKMLTNFSILMVKVTLCSHANWRKSLLLNWRGWFRKPHTAWACGEWRGRHRATDTKYIPST